MSLDTYANLKTAIQTFAMRTGDTEFTASLGDFITLAETMFNYGGGDDSPPIRSPEMITQATATLDANSRATLPTDYLEYREVWSNTDTGNTLTYGTPSELRWRYRGGAGSIPGRFTIVGNEIVAYPMATTSIGLTYYAKIPALSNTNTTNWLLTKAPNVYLYGSLIQAAAYMMDDPRIATWGVMYSKLVNSLNNADRRYRSARGSSIPSGITP